MLKLAPAQSKVWLGALVIQTAQGRDGGIRHAASFFLRISWTQNLVFFRDFCPCISSRSTATSARCLLESIFFDCPVLCAPPPPQAHQLFCPRCFGQGVFEALSGITPIDFSVWSDGCCTNTQILNHTNRAEHFVYSVQLIIPDAVRAAPVQRFKWPPVHSTHSTAAERMEGCLQVPSVCAPNRLGYLVGYSAAATSLSVVIVLLSLHVTCTTIYTAYWWRKSPLFL